MAEDVFDLRFADLEAAAKNSALDLRKLREERTRFRKMNATLTGVNENESTLRFLNDEG
ncbi:MAG: hypothetical protein WDZ76_08905 [Pseudohongiellaceae bacterium]